MANQLQSLLESSAQWKNVQSDAVRLARKWEKTGLLEGLSKTDKSNMALMLENQAKQLVVESSQTGGGTAGATFTAGTGENWAGVALPLVRKVFGQIAAKDFVSVQPMSLPSGLVFFLDYQYGTDKAIGGVNTPFPVGGDVFGSGSTYGVTNATGNPTDGLYGAGRFTYSTQNTSSYFTATVATASWADFNFDSNYSASAAANSYKTLAIDFPTGTNADLKAARGFLIASGSDFNEANNLPEFTSVSGNTVTFVLTGSLGAEQNSYSNVTASFQLAPVDNARGDFEDGNTSLNANNSTISIPEINVKLKSEAIVAKTKKLKAVWTPEFAQDLNAYQNLDAEAELTSIMSEYISMEVDLEILDMLINDALTTERWSAQNNQSLNSSGVATDLGFYNSQGQWFQTLGTKIQKVSNIIHQKTLRGGANFLVCSPTVATILESIPGFASANNGDAAEMSYAFGVQKVGQLNSRYQVYKNPYMNGNTILMGLKGTQYLEAGAAFAPYIPLIMTPLVYDPDTFTPRKGLLTRYAKKMLRPEFYGKIYVAGLDTL
jgi:hypothetical protein